MANILEFFYFICRCTCKFVYDPSFPINSQRDTGSSAGSAVRDASLPTKQ